MAGLIMLLLPVAVGAAIVLVWLVSAGTPRGRGVWRD